MGPYNSNSYTTQSTQADPNGVCEICNTQYQVLALHNRQMCHFYCSACRRSFASEYGLKEHQRQSSVHRTDTHPTSCSSCGQIFPLIHHAILHYERGTCCGIPPLSAVKSLLPLVRQYDHSNNFLTSNERRYKPQRVEDPPPGVAGSSDSEICRRCGTVFATYSALIRHVRSLVHLSTMYQCPCCFSTFKTFGSLSAHIETTTFCDISRSPMLGEWARITQMMGFVKSKRNIRSYQSVASN